MDLQPGDMFLTTGSWISGAINAIQTWWAPDGRSVYTHAGIITHKDGRTLEMTIKGATIKSIWQHDHHPLLIARHSGMTQERFDQGIEGLGDPKSRFYPVYRLFLYLFPPLTRIKDGDAAVCSELVSLFLFRAGLIPYWRGISPDGLHDMFVHWKGFEIVMERS